MTRFVFVILKLFQNNSNAPAKCPFPVGKYYMHDIDIGRISLPPIIPMEILKNTLKCNLVFTSKMKDDRTVFISEYNFYVKLIKK